MDGARVRTRQEGVPNPPPPPPGRKTTGQEDRNYRFSAGEEDVRGSSFSKIGKRGWGGKFHRWGKSTGGRCETLGKGQTSHSKGDSIGLEGKAEKKDEHSSPHFGSRVRPGACPLLGLRKKKKTRMLNKEKPETSTSFILKKNRGKGRICGGGQNGGGRGKRGWGVYGKREAYKRLPNTKKKKKKKERKPGQNGGKGDQPGEKSLNNPSVANTKNLNRGNGSQQTIRRGKGDAIKSENTIGTGSLGEPGAH